MLRIVIAVLLWLPATAIWASDFEIKPFMFGCHKSKINWVWLAYRIDNKNRKIHACTGSFQVKSAEVTGNCREQTFESALPASSRIKSEIHPTYNDPTCFTSPNYALWQIDEVTGATQFCLVNNGPQKCVDATPR
ncbi:hypothetical protein ACFLEY_03830 [Bradyrhizobium sp. YCK136]|uniref:hypothetical protein n=1 Tax=Bradyrhizobium sp. YCK136 TaxID=3351346 RepID=UPI0037C5E5C2